MTLGPAVAAGPMWAVALGRAARDLASAGQGRRGAPFGPIGVSALFYLTMEAHRLGADPQVLAAGTLVIAVSTLVHGATTTPGLKIYRKADLRTKTSKNKT